MTNVMQSTDNLLALSFDIDWAPDFVIDEVAQVLVSNSVKATWFVTHASPAVYRLAKRPDLFELGIHPNFLPGSDHGRTPAEVLAFFNKIIPSAVSVRTHALVQSGPIFDEILTHTKVTVDSSLFLPRMPAIRPVPYWRRGTRTLWRLPIFWSDIAETEMEAPDWTLESLLSTGPGLKVLDFHPIHVYLNSTDGQSYAQFKRKVGRLVTATQAVASQYRHHGNGVGALFNRVVDHLASAGHSLRLCDLMPSKMGRTSER